MFRHYDSRVNRLFARFRHLKHIFKSCRCLSPRTDEATEPRQLPLARESDAVHVPTASAET